ncbi:MAG: hypothetical protein EOO60_07015 [Hymenobacter sp.]|nr:MAG: hypothetical protein EOO60_07015 [Hymenobacter sp.]
MLTNFHVSEDRRTVSWQHESQKVDFTFQLPVYANHIEYLDEVIIHSDALESGEHNLALYKADGTLKVRPAMPKLKHKVHGVYAVWFVQGERQQEIVLLSDEYKPYDTACSFDLETHRFSKFHPTY